MKLKPLLILILLIISYFPIAAQFNYESYIVKFKDSNISIFINENKINSSGFTPLFKELRLSNNSKLSNKIQSPEQKAYAEELKKYHIFNVNSSSGRQLLEKLLASPEIESIEPNRIYRIELPTGDFAQSPDDPKYGEQWALRQVQAEKAWKISTGKDVIVGVIDTGIDFDHPEFKSFSEDSTWTHSQLWINPTEDINANGRFDPWPAGVVKDGVPGDMNGIDDDKNGAIDDVIGYDFVDQAVMNLGDASDPDGIPTDETNHGTLVSGIIAAKANNNIGIAGLAYNAKIMTLRAFDATGNGESDDIAAAIVYAAMNGAKVLNFSFGEPYSSPVLKDAIKFAYSLGCFMASSAGNENKFGRHYPSGYKEVMTVGGSSDNRRKYGDGNYGSMLDISAPGRGVLTTAYHQDYKKANGTSLSAPHVTATAALLLEKNPGLTPAELSGIIRTSAAEAGEFGWDEQFGAGLLNSASALAMQGSSAFKIISPDNEAVINRSKADSLTLFGTITSPLFENYEVYIGEGLLPSNMYKRGSTKTQTQVNDTLATIGLRNLRDTIYTISIRVNQKNTKTMEQRIYINITSDESPLEILTFKKLDIWDDGKKAVLVAAKTSHDASFYVKYRPAGSNDDFKSISEIDNSSRYHSIMLGEGVPADVLMEASAVAFRGTADSVVYNFQFIKKNEELPTDKFSRKPYGLPLSYIFNGTSDIRGNGKNAFVVNDISSLSIGTSYVYEYEKVNEIEKMVVKDSSLAGWITVGFGDSNGDGIPEILGTGGGATSLSQRDADGSSPYSNVLYESQPGEKFWSRIFYDLDNDGSDEIIAYNDTAYFAYKNIGGKYLLLGVVPLEPGQNRMQVSKASAVADFDGDGYVELCYTNGRGSIFVYEFRDGKFNLEFQDLDEVGIINQYMCAPDIDGDGSKEILHMFYGSNMMFGESTRTHNIWSYRILQSTAANSYDIVWTGHISGVRAGFIPSLKISYKNGVACGDIDSRPGDEIVLSTFPNLHVFSWDDSSKEMEPLWRYGSAYSNSALIHDFDGNGINEIGFSTFSSMAFYEYDANISKPSVPAGFDGWATGNSAAYLKWDPVAGTDSYELRKLNDDNSLIFYAATNETEIIIDTLSGNTLYRFVIRSFSLDSSEQFSDFSRKIAEVYTHDQVQPVGTEVNNSKSINVLFSGKLPHDNIEPSNFQLYDSDNNLFSVPQSALVINDSAAVLIFNDEIPNGAYRLDVSSFRDYYNSPTLEAALDIDLNLITPPGELYLKKLEFIANTKLILLSYSEAVDTTVLNISNYELQPLGSIIFVEFNTLDSSQVRLVLDNAARYGARGKDYTLTVRNVRAASGVDITKGAGNTLGFVLPAKSLEQPYIYPNPIKLSESLPIFFANLTTRATITIYKPDGELITIIEETDGNGGVEWNGKDRSGNIIPEGVYLYTVTGSDKDGIEFESELQKFMVVP